MKEAMLHMREMADPDVAGSAVEQIRYFVELLCDAKIPAGGLGCCRLFGFWRAQHGKVLRFFFGRLEPLENWGAKLAEAFKKEIGAC